MTPNPSLVDPGASKGDESPGSGGGDAEASATAASNPIDLEKTQPGSSAHLLARTKDDSDDSLEAILLQAGARAPQATPSPPRPTAKTPIGSKTLMGVGVEGLNLPALRRAFLEKTKSAEKTPIAAKAGTDVPLDDLVESGGGAHGTPTPPVGRPTPASSGKPKSSLLDEVAQALNVQASEVRDRARGRLPGMSHGSGVSSGASPRRERVEAEFEDPDDGPTALTPGSVTLDGESSHGEVKEVAALLSEDEEAVVLGRASQSGPTAMPKADSRPIAVPPVPGSSAFQSGPVGPPPGFQQRVTTPSGGVPLPQSGRLRLPTPTPGSLGPTGHPTPPLSMSGRVVVPLEALLPKDADLTATAPSTPISLEASRRVAAGMGSGGVSGSAPVARRPRSPQRAALDATAGLPAVLRANVKLPTISLAGLIAVTFIGGLFVGMMVWKGQGREPAPPPVRLAGPTAPTAAPTPAPTTVIPRPPAAVAVTPSPPPAPTAVPVPPPSATVKHIAPSVVATHPAPSATPPRNDSEPDDASAKSTKRASATTKPPRAKRPVADTSSDLPAAAPAKTSTTKSATRTTSGSGSSKTMATNASGKPATKAKSKSGWHDPFAD